jgi:flagellar hook protein FlgE
MSDSLGASISGIQAAISRHDVTANNVANVNTPGYERITAYQTDVAPQGTRISHLARTPNANPATSNTDLALSAQEQKENKASLQANASVIKTKDRMIGDLLDIVA